MDQEMRKQRIRAKQKELITRELQASREKAEDVLTIQLDIPVYNSIDQLPDEEEGSIVFVKEEGLLMEDGK